MEDVVAVDAAKLEERQGHETEVFEPRIEDNVAFNLDGLKESTKDEIFEDAVKAETPVVYSDNGNTIKDGNVDSFETLESNPNAVQNTETGTSAQFLMNENRPDENHSSMEKAVSDERNGTMDDGIVEDKKVDSMEIADSSAAESGNLNGVEVKENLLNAPQNIEDALTDNATSVQTWTSDDAKIVDADRREWHKLQMSEIPESNELRGAGTDQEKPDIKGNDYEKSENQDANEVKGGGDIGFERSDTGAVADASFVGSPNHADSNNKQSRETSTEAEETNGSNESVDRLEPESNGDILHNDKLITNINEPVAGSASTNLLHELKDGHARPTNLRDDEKKGEKEADSESMKVEMTDVLDVGKKESRDISSDFHHVVEDTDANLDRGNDEKPYFSSSNSLAEKLGSFQQQLVDANSHALSAVAEGPKKVGVENEREYKFSGNGAQKENTVSGMLLSSGDSTSRITPVHPVGLEPTAPVQEGVSKGNPVNREQKVKDVAEISSKKSANPHPSGLGHTAPKLEPAPTVSGNKERGSKKTDVPPANSNIAATHPAGLGRAAPLLEPTSRVVQQPRVNGAGSPLQNQLIEDPTNGEAEEYDETREKLQMIRVKFLRLAHRLGQTPHNVVVAQVLYRLGLAEQLQGRSGSRVAAFSFDRASAMAEQLEASGQELLDFTCTIMVLGKTGVGKSATINSIFDEVMFGTDAFQLGTKKVQDIVGTVQGIRVRVIDTPGLLPSWSDQCQNEKILRSVKKFIKKSPPDIVLYLDRLDMQSRDFGDTLLLRTITEIFGPSIWFNAIVVLTHAASAPPEGPNGTTTSYDMFVTQRSHVVQQAIRQAAGDMRLMNPISLVENHSACRTNRAGQRVLPNGQVWKPHLLLLSFASKILAEANTLLKLQDGPPGKSFAPRAKSPPLPFLLSSLLQSRPEVKLPSEQFGDDDDALDDDMDESSDSDDEPEYDELPPFTSLTKAQLQKLNKVQRKAYYDELEYREKLFMKKQLKEEKRRRMMTKKILEEAKNSIAEYGENAEEEASGAASVPVPMPDLALPASFDSDNPTHRYRSLDSSNPWIVRAVLEPNGWDHDIGYDGINAERLFVVKNKIPVSFSGHLSKDKKDGNLQMEIASSVKHGTGKATSLGFDMQSIGKDFAYTVRTETRFGNHRINKATGGLSATLLGDVLTGGLKVEDKLLLGKRGQLVVSGGAMIGRGDVAYGGSLEASLRDKDHPLGRFLSTLGISVMDWHGDLAIGSNFHTQIPVGRHTNLIGRLNFNNKGSGQVSIRVNSSEQLQIVLIGLIPLVQKILGYSQPVQYG